MGAKEDFMAALSGSGVSGGQPTQGFSGFTGSVDPPVYWGRASTADGGHPTQRMAVETKNASEALAEFYSWDDAERAQWGKRLYAAGYTKNPDDWDAQLAGWKYAVQSASDYYVSAGKKITPWAFMDMKQDQIKEARPETHTSTSTSVNLPSKSDAAAAVKAMFKDQLGRDATDGEIDRYSSMMLAQYRQNPNKTVTTSTTSADGNTTTSNSLQQGGFNPQGWLEDKAQADPEYGAYQASTTYFNALMGAIGAGADVG